MFLLNEKIVYPGYGVAVINRLVERLVSGKQTHFFELKFYNKEMTVLVPEARLEAVGVRKVSTQQDLVIVLAMLHEFGKDDIVTEHNASTWNKRNKDYQCKLRSGKLDQLALIYKELQLIALDKELSFGERNLFNQIESLLIEEIIVIQGISVQEAQLLLRKPFEQMNKKIQKLIPIKGQQQVATV